LFIKSQFTTSGQNVLRMDNSM